MTVVFLILKVIGILLLAILALLVVSVLLVLFVPVRYRARGSWQSQLTLTLRVSFLLHLFVFGVDMLPEKNDVYLRIFGFKKILTKADNTEEFEDTIEEIAEEETAIASEETKEAADAFVRESVREKEAEDGEEVHRRKPPKKEPRQKERRVPFLKALLQRIRELLERIRAAFVRFIATAQRIQRLWEKESNRQAVHFLGERLFLLLKKAAPKKLMLDMAYSTGAPDTTGELLGVLALFPIAYRQRWNITPDFTADRFYVDARFEVQGRILICQVLRIALSVLLDKNCRKLYNEIKNGS